MQEGRGSFWTIFWDFDRFTGRTAPLPRLRPQDEALREKGFALFSWPSLRLAAKCGGGGAARVREAEGLRQAVGCGQYPFEIRG